MSSVSSTNPGVANLLQLLSNSGSQVLNSSKVTSALAKAPTSDIVQLSANATEIQNVDTLFGISSGGYSNTTGSASSLADLLTGTAGASATSQGANANPLLSAAALSNASPTDQLAYYQSLSQASQTQGILNAGAMTNQSGSLVDVIG